MKRYAQETHLLDRRVREWRALSSGSPLERGRFRKRKPLDCGRARCGLCHREKKFDRPSLARKRSDQAAAFDLRSWHEGA